MDSFARRLNERRATARLPAAEHGIVSARVRPGHEATVINVSATGILIETICRLLPGARIELHVRGQHARITSWGRVLRASVADVAATTVRYRGAIALDRPLAWPTGPFPQG